MQTLIDVFKSRPATSERKDMIDMIEEDPDLIHVSTDADNCPLCNPQ